ncbi:MAG: ligase-associated DNA damage response endonuclease PdeM [Aquaticitalea sp.]
MSIVIKEIECCGEKLTLTNQRALYWKREQMLVLSDLHIGKTAHFRKAGIAIPSQVLNSDLKRLKGLIHHFETTKLLIVGDLFHAEVNKDIQSFKEWKNQFETIEWRLVKGNHDRLKSSVYADLGIEVDKDYKETSPFRFVHDVEHCADDIFCISGHTHPGVLIKGRGKQFIKLPCFQVSKTQLTLPAFSEFTGLNTSCGEKDTVCYAFTKTNVFEI